MAIGVTVLLFSVAAAWAQSTGRAILRGTVTDPYVFGFAQFDQIDEHSKFLVHVFIQNITVGPNVQHAVHVHSWGDVMDPLGEASGDVLNPFSAARGCPETGPHPLGNMGNWQAVNGVINQTKSLDLVSTKYIAGRTVVVHSLADDCATSQSTGVRLAQGVVGINSVATSSMFSSERLIEMLKMPSKLLLSTRFGQMMEEHLEHLEAAVLGDSLPTCQITSPLWGSLGSSLGVAFANAGAAYGLAASFNGYISLAMTPRVDRLMLVKGLVPGIMASVRGVYGLIIAILITVNLKEDSYPLMKGFAHLFSGLCVGLTGIASGYCMGVIGDYGLRAVGKKAKLYINILLIIIFCEAIGLYGLIIGLILIGQGNQPCSGF